MTWYQVLRTVLSPLSGNLGIDVPDGVVDIVPYAGAILAGARLVYSVLQTERQFKAADRTTKNKIQVVQSPHVDVTDGSYYRTGDSRVERAELPRGLPYQAWATLSAVSSAP